MPSFKYPSSERLAAVLTRVLSRNGLANGDLTVVNRKPNPYNSTFPTEIVTCHNGPGRSIPRLFVKYRTGGFDGVFGHRRDISYEARVYREVLQPLHVSTPAFYGLYKDDESGAEGLIIEYLPRGSPASWSRDPQAMTRSARWIGRFHAANEKRVHDARLQFLRRYNAEYYRGWARRTNLLFGQLNSRFPWIPPICTSFQHLIPRLLRAPETIIHGEYFGSNVVYQNGTSRPVDWQSTAIAAGEIDLAALTHSWPKKVVQKCEREYARARWSGRAPDGFEETLELARVYMNLRWLGDPNIMSPLVSRRGRLVASKKMLVAMQAVLQLHSVGERLGLL